MHPHGRRVLHPSRHSLGSLWKPHGCTDTCGQSIHARVLLANGGFTHIFIAVDKFTKWIEAKLAASIAAAMVVEFVSEITYWFGVPNNIIMDNGTLFTTREFKDFCDGAGIKINYASILHRPSNGQVKQSNDMILQGLKPRIFNRLKPFTRKWMELPSVLWALRTTSSWDTGKTPFSLVYGSEAMMPTEVKHSSF
jgi:hypothetical protein